MAAEVVQQLLSGLLAPRVGSHHEAQGPNQRLYPPLEDPAPQIGIGPPDRLEFRRVQEGSRDANEVLVRAHPNLSRAYLATVPQYAQMEFGENGLSSQILTGRFKVNDHWCSCHELGSMGVEM
jgi:hypothetical protein